MTKRKPQAKHPATPRNQIALIIAFVAIVLLLLFLRLVIFVHGVNAHHHFW
jgi:hypothetical protein